MTMCISSATAANYILEDGKVKESKQPIDFEKKINELEKIVKNMEEGSLNLEDSLKFFEDGIKITRECQQALKDAELKVEMLTMGSGKLEAFEPEDN